MLEPDLVRHRRRPHGEGPRLQELDTRVVPRPLDFSRAADEFLAFAHEECELSDLLGIEARRAEERARERPPAVRESPPPATRAGTSGWMRSAIAVSAGSRPWVAM